MGQVSRVLRQHTRGYSFYCPGCKEMHSINTDGGPGPNWSFNGDVERPIFGPSILCTTYRYPENYDPDNNPEHAEIRDRFENSSGGHEWMMNHPKWGRRCHSFVGCNGAQPGEIVFLSDCTHELAGQTVPMASLPEPYQG